MDFITFNGQRGRFKLNKSETQAKEFVNQHSKLIDDIIAKCLEDSVSPEFMESLTLKLFNNKSCYYEPIKCAFLSTSTFQPSKFYCQLRNVFANQKRTIQFYETQPSLQDLLKDVTNKGTDFVGVFDVSNVFDRKFYKKVVDLLTER